MPGATKRSGYGSQHQKERARWAPIVQAGQAYCHARVCLMPTRWIPPDQPGKPTGWHLGHNPARTAWTGPEHAICNLRDGAVRGARIASRKSRTRRAYTRW